MPSKTEDPNCIEWLRTCTWASFQRMNSPSRQIHSVAGSFAIVGRYRDAGRAAARPFPHIPRRRRSMTGNGPGMSRRGFVTAAGIVILAPVVPALRLLHASSGAPAPFETDVDIVEFTDAG